MELDRCEKCGRSFKKNRSNNQNKYAHGVIFKMIAEEMGEYDEGHVKDLMKHKFLTYETTTTTKSGHVITEKKTKHTSELSTVEMEEFLFKCRNWAREWLKLDIPEPNMPTIEAYQ